MWDIVDLQVAEDQEDFVSSNGDSIIEAYTTPGTGCTAIPFGIYEDEEPVGFVMVGYNEGALHAFGGDEVSLVWFDNYSLWRIMIDENHQRKGYGRAAMELALDFIRTKPCGEAEYCVLSYEPENEVARKFYASLGFVETGVIDHDEMVAVLKL